MWTLNDKISTCRNVKEKTITEIRNRMSEEMKLGQVEEENLEYVVRYS